MKYLTNPIELNDSEFSNFRFLLLKEKGSSRQRKFLEGVRDSKVFLNEMSHISKTGFNQAGIVSEEMTENQYKEPPSCTEQDLYETWPTLAPAVACRTTFWAQVTVEHIRAGRIRSSYLASKGGNMSLGAERIDFALLNDTSERSKLIDDCVRTVLRRLGGLPEVRGNRSVYVDCPFARAWWREKMTRQAAKGSAQVEGDIRKILRANLAYWEKLIDRIVFRNSTFGSENIRGAFLRTLSEFVICNPDSDFSSTKGLQRLCRRVTAYQGTRELGVLDDAELEEVMREVVGA